MSIIRAQNVDLSKITFSDVKTDVHGRKMVFFNSKQGKLIVQTPKMIVPNGIKKWRKADALNNRDDKFEMEMSFRGLGTDQAVTAFHEKWTAFDEFIKKAVIAHSKEWLGVPTLSMDTLESVMYKPMVRVPKDKDGNDLPYPSRIKVKLDREFDAAGNPTGKFLSNKRFKTEILFFDENKEKMAIDETNVESEVPKGSEAICVMELVYLSLSKTCVCTKWKLVQTKIFKNSNAITEYALLEDEDSESGTPAAENPEAAEVEAAMAELRVNDPIDPVPETEVTEPEIELEIDEEPVKRVRKKKDQV